MFSTRWISKPARSICEVTKPKGHEASAPGKMYLGAVRCVGEAGDARREAALARTAP